MIDVLNRLWQKGWSRCRWVDGKYDQVGSGGFRFTQGFPRARAIGIIKEGSPNTKFDGGDGTYEE